MLADVGNHCNSCARSRELLRFGNIAIGDIFGTDNIQTIADAVSQSLVCPRCVVFRIKYPSPGMRHCYLIAGTPKGEHDLTHNTPIEEKPDILSVCEKGDILLIENPKENELTRHFIGQIYQKNVNQILYIPLTFGFKTRKVRAVIVLDAVDNMVFSEAAMDMCYIIGQFISLILNFEDYRNLKESDEFGGPITGVIGLAKRVLSAIEQLSVVLLNKGDDLVEIREDLKSVISTAKKIEGAVIKRREEGH